MKKLLFILLYFVCFGAYSQTMSTTNWVRTDSITSRVQGASSKLNIIHRIDDRELFFNDTTAYDWLQVHGGTNVTFGTDNQVPFVNAGGTDFDYGGLEFTGSLLDLKNSTPILRFTDTDTNGYTALSGNSGNVNFQLRVDETSLGSSPSFSIYTQGVLRANFTHSGQLQLPETTNQLRFGTTNTTTISATAPSVSRTYTIPDFGSNDSFVGVAATQTLTNKSLTSPTITGSPTASGATWASLGTVTTADINGGTIDGTTIGGSSAAAGTFTTGNFGGNVSIVQAASSTLLVQGTSTLARLHLSSPVTDILFNDASTSAYDGRIKVDGNLMSFQGGDNAGDPTTDYLTIGLNGGAATFSGTVSGAFNGTLGATTPSTVAATTVSASGNINSTGGAIQTNTVTRISNAGAATLTGLTSSGTITFSGLSAAGIVRNTAAGVLSTSIGTASQLLRTNSGATDVEWFTPDYVAGPASATDDAIARYDATTGDLIQNSGVIIGDEVSNGVTVHRGSTDGSDNKLLQLAGGGGSGNTRGATVQLNGNEHASAPGQAVLAAGNVANGYIQLVTFEGTVFMGASNPVRIVGKIPYTSAPAGTLNSNEWEQSLYDDGASPVVRFRYNDAGTTKTIDVGPLVSDTVYKKSWEPMLTSDAKSFVMNTKAYKWHGKGDVLKGEHWGFIANYSPKSPAFPISEDGTYHWKPEHMIAPLYAVVQEQQKEIDGLKSKLSSLEERILAIEKNTKNK